MTLRFTSAELVQLQRLADGWGVKVGEALRRCLPRSPTKKRSEDHGTKEKTKTPRPRLRLSARLKDDESRVVPILKALIPILAEWKLAEGGVGLVFPPRYATRGGRPGTPPAFTRPNTLWRHLEKALTKCKLPNLTWYQATRHTFASQFILGGGSIEKLSKIMGHASVTTTERYAHLRTDLFRESDFDLVAVDLSTPGAQVVSLHPETEKGTVGYATVTDSSAPPAKAALNS